MDLTMLQAKAIPQLSVREKSFVVDFVPVDYIAKGIGLLSKYTSSQGSEQGKATIYYLSNPSPPSLENLPGLMQEIRNGGEVTRAGRSLPFNGWFEAVSAMDGSADAQVRWAVLRGVP
ncbi:hypothetical protein BDW74DRAFT_172346 [Aspergillus multicolor]|uniref:uncharacterized protein n=1 Tax=Aspergillus multicolor TaxID=41759 RepID=UPI003CCD6F0F